jgi:hypothetical protein
MTDATASRPTAKPGFSSKWMLDSSARERATTVAGDANASARPIDTDGDGVADTLAVRVDTTPEGVASRIGSWITRSFVTVLLVASLVAAAAAGTAYMQAQRELDRTTSLLQAERSAAEEARSDAATAAARVTELEGAALKADRDQLELENQVLRRMLLDEERSTSTSR